MNKIVACVIDFLVAVLIVGFLCAGYIVGLFERFMYYALKKTDHK